MGPMNSQTAAAPLFNHLGRPFGQERATRESPRHCTLSRSCRRVALACCLLAGVLGAFGAMRFPLFAMLVPTANAMCQATGIGLLLLAGALAVQVSRPTFRGRNWLVVG